MKRIDEASNSCLTFIYLELYIVITEAIRSRNSFTTYHTILHVLRGGGQYLEQLYVERPTLHNFEISNIKITKDELFDSNFFIFVSIFRNTKIYNL